MRLRHIAGAAEFVAAHPQVIQEQQALSLPGQWPEVFANSHPLHLEIGMGRGRFLLSAAQAEPQINFIGLELCEEVIMQALQRYQQLPENIRILWLNAQLLDQVFAPGEIAKIYLNFPDPWPKNRHAKRRLTWDDYLQKYRRVLAAAGTLRFKTDNPQLFDWSRARFAANGWEPLTLSHDLPLEESGIISEYEARYRRLGQPICCGEWRRPELQDGGGQEHTALNIIEEDSR